MLIKLSPPATPAVDLDLAKAHLRVDGSAENVTIQAYLDAALATVEDRTTLALAATQYEQRFDCWPSSGRWKLGVAPVRDVVAIRWRDEDGVAQTLDAADWYWVPTHEGADVILTDAFAAPALQGRDGDIAIEFEAGCDNDGASGSGEERLRLPAQAVSCVLLLVGSWYRFREDPQTVMINSLPLGVEALLAQLRIYR